MSNYTMAVSGVFGKQNMSLTDAISATIGALAMGQHDTRSASVTKIDGLQDAIKLMTPEETQTLLQLPGLSSELQKMGVQW